MEDFAAKVIAAHQAGLAERRQEEALQQQQEDRKFQIELQKHQLKAMQLADKAAARQEAIQNVGLMAGQSAPSTVIQPGQTGPLPPELNPGGPQPQAITSTLPPQVIPGVQGEDITVTPPSQQDIQAQDLQKLLTQMKLESLKPFTLEPGAQRVTPSLTGGAPSTVLNPKAPEPKAFEFEQQQAENYYRKLNNLPEGATLNALQKSVAGPIYKAYQESLKPPPAPQLPMSPERFQQEKELRLLGANQKGPISYVDLDPKAQQRVDSVAEKVSSGEFTISNGLAALGGVRGGLGGALTEALGGTLVLPPQIRQANNDIERAKNLLVPVHQLVDEINKTKDTAEKAKKSLQLDQYVQSIGTQLARARGERGVVTDRDVSRVLGLVPGWKSANFAPGYAQENLKLIEDAFNRDQSALLGKYFTKYPQSGGSTTPATPAAAGKTITEGLIQANLKANKGATRQQIIDALKAQGYNQ